jgi:hypothetical protein
MSKKVELSRSKVRRWTAYWYATAHSKNSEQFTLKSERIQTTTNHKINKKKISAAIKNNFVQFFVLF